MSDRRNGTFLSHLLLVTMVSLSQVVQVKGAANSSDTTSVQYRVEGSISYLLGTSTTPDFERAFTLTVSNSDWDIRIIPNDVQRIEYYEVVHLGDDIYYYTAFQNQPSDTALNNGTAKIARQEQPVERGMFASYIWLGLASSSYFMGHSSNAVQPIWAKSSAADTVKAKWATFDRKPYLPKHVAYFHSGRNHSAPFDHGWLAGEYNASLQTNVAGLTIPTEFIFEYRQPKEDAIDLKDLEPAFRVKVTVQSVLAPVLTSIMPPAMQGPTLIEEQRLPGPLSSDMSVQYLSTNRMTLPRAREETATRKYEVLKSIAVAKPEHSSATFRYAFLVFLVISSGIAIFVAVRRKQH